MKKILSLILLSMIITILFIQSIDAQSLIPYRKGDKWGFCDKLKKILIEPKFDAVYRFSDGYTAVKIENMFGYMDSTGRFITDIKYDVSYGFADGLAIVARNLNVEKTNTFGIKYFTVEMKYGFIDKKGREVIPLIYGDVYSFQPNGLALVGLGKYVKNSEGKDYFEGKWGYVNKKGEVVIPIKYSKLGIFRDGLAYAQMGSRFGFINEKDELTIPFKYDDVNNDGFNDGYASVSANEKWFFIDKTGNEYYEESISTAK